MKSSNSTCICLKPSCMLFHCSFAFQQDCKWVLKLQMMHSANHCTDFIWPSFTYKVLIVLFYRTRVNVISLIAIRKVRPFLRPFSGYLLSVIMCRSLVPIFISVGQSVCEVWTAIHLLCMYGFHCADFHGTLNHPRRIMGSSPSLWKNSRCPCPKKGRQVR
jgi:hypothetical protein